MDRVAVIKNIGFEPFTRQDISNSAHTLAADFKDTQLRNLIGNMLSSNEIIRVGRNLYSKADASKLEQNYLYTPSEEINTKNWLNTFEIIQILNLFKGISLQHLLHIQLVFLTA